MFSLDYRMQYRVEYLAPVAKYIVDGTPCKVFRFFSFIQLKFRKQFVSLTIVTPTWLLDCLNLLIPQWNYECYLFPIHHRHWMVAVD